MRTLRQILSLASILSLVLILGGCNTFIFLFGDASTDPRGDLIGTWIIDSSGGCSTCDTYYAINVLGDDTFTITDASDVLIEQNDMTEITDSSFVGNINVQEIDAGLVGTATYAEYEITFWKGSIYLKLVFYDDDTKQTKFVTFYCTKEV